MAAGGCLLLLKTLRLPHRERAALAQRRRGNHPLPQLLHQLPAKRRRGRLVRVLVLPLNALHFLRTSASLAAAPAAARTLAWSLTDPAAVALAKVGASRCCTHSLCIPDSSWSLTASFFTPGRAIYVSKRRAGQYHAVP